MLSKNGWLKKSKFVRRKKTHPEHKYSVTFDTKVGTKSLVVNWRTLVFASTKNMQDIQIFRNGKSITDIIILK